MCHATFFNTLFSPKLYNRTQGITSDEQVDNSMLRKFPSAINNFMSLKPLLKLTERNNGGYNTSAPSSIKPHWVPFAVMKLHAAVKHDLVNINTCINVGPTFF